MPAAAPPKPYPHPKYPGITVRTLRSGALRYDVRATATGSGGSGKKSRTFTTLRDARAFLAERDKRRIVMRTGIDLDRGTETFVAHVNWWWEHYAKKRLQPTTRDGHARAIRTHLVPRIGHLELRQITPDVVFAVLSDMQENRVGAAQVERTMRVLSGVLKRAVERGRIDANPCRDIQVPHAKRLGVIRPWTPEQVERIRAYFWDDPDFRLYISLCYLAGTRPAEARRQRVRDVLWDAGSIDIVDREQAGAEGRRTGNKADGGRSMHLLDALRADLMDAGIHKVEDPNRHVVVDERGRPWDDESHASFFKRWRVALKACELERQRVYILRHTHASLRIYEQRWTDNDIATMLGHDVRTLHDYYAHLIRETAGRGPLDLDREIRIARDRHGTHPIGVELPDANPVRLTITATDRYGHADPDRYRAVLTAAGLTDITITQEALRATD